MIEYRQNPVTGEWVIIAEARGRRPDSFEPAPPSPRPARLDSCPFCPGNERQTPPEVYAVRDDYATVDKEGWRIRVVPNKYPAVKIDAEGVPTPESVAFGEQADPAPPERSDLRVSMPAVGMHEVVIDSPAHDREFADLDRDQAEQVVLTLRHRCAMIVQAREVRHVSVFKNRGAAAGATLEHPHFQIIATSLIPSGLKKTIERAEGFSRERQTPLMRSMLDEELAAGTRIISTNDEFVTLAPWASAWSHEMWIVPREQAPFFHRMADGHVPLFTAAVTDALRRLNRVLDRPDFNLVIQNGPKWQKTEQHHCWYARIVPRTHRMAGFELGSGIHINSTPPETAAAALRERTDEP